MSNPIEFKSALLEKLEDRFDLDGSIASINKQVYLSQDMMSQTLILLRGLISKAQGGDPQEHVSAIKSLLRVAVLARHSGFFDEERQREIFEELHSQRELLVEASRQENRSSRDRIILHLLGVLYTTVIHEHFYN